MRGNRKRNTEAGKGACHDVSDGKASGAPSGLAGTGPGVSSLLKLPHLLSIALLITLLDQTTKRIVVSHLYLHESVRVVSRIFSITRVHNSGIAFGLFPGLPDVFMVVTLVSMLIVLYFYLTVEPRGAFLTLGCGLILGGAMGNLIDRFRFGYVVDFIDFSFWPAFNIADSAVSVGVALLLVNVFRGRKGMAEDASDSA